MKSLAWMTWRVVLAVLLMVVTVRSGHLALYNWWAASGPPTPNPEHYQRLGNVFFGVASVSLAGALTLIVDAIRDWRKQRSTKLRSAQT